VAEGQSHPKYKMMLVVFLGVLPIAVFLALAIRPYFGVRVVQEKKAPSIKSSDLKRTAVVPTLDSPLPEHRNVIWCATFQMAWDHLKQDVVKEPIKLINAQPLADRLNNGQFPADDIEAGSYYATAGFVEKGIIEEVQKEMARRFPSAPRPRFDTSYTSLPRTILAYAYLSVSVDFTHPYFVRQRALDFTDSNHVRTAVTSFTDRSSASDANTADVRRQVEVLSCQYDSKGHLTSHALDLCKDSQPYQIVLAVVPRGDTLDKTLAAAEKGIADFRNDPQYGELRNLRPEDYLIVPDVLYKLDHSFSELMGKDLGNADFNDLYIFEARQMIDFSLSRTGVVLRSSARAAASPSAVRVLPRAFCFDAPFLIYVKKRQPDARPFLVMWVDNAELMPAFPAASQR
jgi:hypothetical protein